MCLDVLCFFRTPYKHLNKIYLAFIITCNKIVIKNISDDTNLSFLTFSSMYKSLPSFFIKANILGARTFPFSNTIYINYFQFRFKLMPFGGN